ncbi:MAG TPA: hypothetical protein VFB46_09090 [Gemmatimonadaceae bacterium]|nr:hypothetical protein [Gemmatimonadaceae bacterium]
MSRLLLLCAVTMVCGCTTAYPVNRAADLEPREAVFVRFERPRDLEAKSDTVTYALPEVRSLVGGVEGVRGDSLLLRLYEVGSRRLQPALPRDARLTVVPDATARISTRHFSFLKTAGLAILVYVAVATVMFVSDPPMAGVTW